MKRNKSESVELRWTNLETFKKSEVNQEKKNKYCMLMHICGIQKNGIDERICKAEIETQTQRTSVWIARGDGMNWDMYKTGN